MKCNKCNTNISFIASIKKNVRVILIFNNSIKIEYFY